MSRSITTFAIILALALYSYLPPGGIDNASASDEASEMAGFDPEHPFFPSNDAMADVDAVLARASDSGKLALIVMGANWCHDSRSLAHHFKDLEMAAILEESYELIFVDVGYLDTGAEIISRFGMPVIYGTPTVLVVDPDTETLLNSDNFHQWRDAYTMNIEEVRAEFTKFATPRSHGPITHPSFAELDSLLAEIDAFENNQAERLYRAFGVLGPLLAMAPDERPEHFGDYWGQVYDYRYQITDDLAALRAEARQRALAGEIEIALNYPEYEPFDWESDE